MEGIKNPRHEFLIKELECDKHNIKMAINMPRTPRTVQFIRRTLRSMREITNYLTTKRKSIYRR